MTLLDKSRVKVLAFDLFGTVFDVSDVPREELQAYGDTIRAPEWQPFVWPKHWEKLPAFPDAEFGLRALQALGYYTVALSNAPLALAMRMIANAELDFNAIIPLETQQLYKPNPGCYTFAQTLCGVEREEFAMISANKSFGDIEAALSLGMHAQLIRNPDMPETILDLVRLLTR